jgi:hypothetical protein
MTALFCVVGIAEDGRGRVWPVCYRLVREEAEQAKGICEAQRDKFITMITPVIERIREVKREQPSLNRFRGSRTLSRRREDKWRYDFHAAREREAAINAQFANEMLDPLYPTSTNGHVPNDVVYKILEFWDDPREMGPASLMKLRATVHGAFTDDDDDEDEDFT